MMYGLLLSAYIMPRNCWRRTKLSIQFSRSVSVTKSVMKNLPPHRIVVTTLTLSNSVTLLNRLRVTSFCSETLEGGYSPVLCALCAWQRSITMDRVAAMLLLLGLLVVRNVIWREFLPRVHHVMDLHLHLLNCFFEDNKLTWRYFFSNPQYIVHLFT